MTLSKNICSFKIANKEMKSLCSNNCIERICETSLKECIFRNNGFIFFKISEMLDLVSKIVKDIVSNNIRTILSYDY